MKNIILSFKISFILGLHGLARIDLLPNALAPNSILELKNPIIYGAIIVILTSIILVVLKPSFLKVKNDQTGDEKINYGYMIATILGISFCLIICIYFVLKKF